MIVDFFFVLSILTWTLGMLGVLIDDQTTYGELEEKRKVRAVTLTIISTGIFMWCMVYWKDSAIIRLLIQL